MTLQPRIRFKPFSHVPGTACLIPGSWLFCRAYPALVRIYTFFQKEPIAELVFDVPEEPFTVIQDLEKGSVSIGACKLYGTSDPNSWALEPPGAALHVPRERLHLGNHKKQQWPQAAYRSDLEELLPIWYWLAGWVPALQPEPALFSTRSLFTKAVDVEGLLKFFKAGFEGIFVPRLFDDDYHGYSLPVVGDTSIHPLLLLQESRVMIRAMFFKEEGGLFSFLPHRPFPFHCGCMADLLTKKGHKISFEWTKHALRRVLIEAACDDTVQLSFPKELKRCRFEGAFLANQSRLTLIQGKKYMLDNFCR